jgi:hypothetical protein
MNMIWTCEYLPACNMPYTLPRAYSSRSLSMTESESVTKENATNYYRQLGINYDFR